MTAIGAQAVQATVTELWTGVLGRAPLKSGENFFDAGGTSLTALVLIGRVERELGVELSLAAFLSDPTVEGIGAAVTGGEDLPIGPQLLVLRRGTHPDPLVVVHTITGSVIGYAQLARGLGDGRGCWGFQAAALEAGSARQASIPELAAEYVALLRERRPAGPYLLGGWSLGGIVAQEMACRLVEAGAEVGPLVIFDTQTAGANLEPTVANALFLLGLALKSAATADGTNNDLERLRRDAAAAGTLDPETPISRLDEMVEMYRLHLDSVSGHVPRRFDGDMILFEAETQLEEPTGPHLGWQPYVSGTIDRVVVAGDHYTLLKPPNSSRVAELVSERLPA